MNCGAIVPRIHLDLTLRCYVPRSDAKAWTMDDESLGLFGALLIVTALVMSQSLHNGHAMSLPSLPAITWEEVANASLCGQETPQDCEAALTR
jgi:hypothetical protein